MEIIKYLQSKDGISTKYVQRTDDDHQIETTYVDYKNKHIICYSTQIGCSGNCNFCYTGISRTFIRNLSAYEIFKQCKNVVELIDPLKKDKPILFSAMGIGDPLSNYRSYILSAELLVNEFPSSKLALATRVPYLDSLKLLIKHSDLHMKVMVSLHSADDNIRLKLIPQTIPVHDIIEEALLYEIITKNDVEYNVTLIDGINDSTYDAARIAELLSYRYSSLGIIPKIKINKFNKVANCKFEPSTNVTDFINIMKSYNVQVEYYETDGTDINAACGQMVCK